MSVHPAARLLTTSVLAAVLVSGCAHEEHGSAGSGLLDDLFPPRTAMIVAEPVEHPSATDAQIMPIHQASTVSWGEPVVLPAGLVGPQAVADSDGRYLLDTGDRLRVFVYGQPNLSRLYNVDHEGKISVPLIGNIKIRGMTTYGVESTIRQRLGTQFVKDPQVTVDVQQNRPFFILGEVRNAGQFPYVSGMTIETAVAIAGGYSERASTRRAKLTRRINGLVEVIEAPTDYVVQPGDTVTIYERIF